MKELVVEAVLLEVQQPEAVVLVQLLQEMVLRVLQTPEAVVVLEVLLEIKALQVRLEVVV